MKCNPQQFYQQQTCHPVYLISTDEPFLQQQACDHVRKLAKQAGYLERTVLEVGARFDWQQLHYTANETSLFSDKTLIELRLGKYKPGTPGSKAIKTYLATLPEDKLLLISSAKLEAAQGKSQWVKAITGAGIWLPLWPLNAAERRQWLQRQLQQHKLQITADAGDLLLAQTQGNLLACAQEVEKLSLLFEPQTLGIEQIQQAISQQAKYTVFDVIDSWLQGKRADVLTMLQRLAEEDNEPILLLWAISREVKQLLTIALQAQQQGLASALQQQVIWGQRLPLIKQHLQNHTLTYYQQLLLQIATIDRLNKGAERGNAWQAITRLLVMEPVLT